MNRIIRTAMPVVLMIAGSAFGWQVGDAIIAAADPVGHIDPSTSLPLGWVLGGFVAMLTVGLWVGTTATRIKDRLDTIEAKLDSRPCISGKGFCPLPVKETTV